MADTEAKSDTTATIDAADQLVQGKRHMLVQDYVSAVSSLEEACKGFAQQYGETANECGEAYLCYGKALLELARMENGVLGNALQGAVDSEEESEGSKDSEGEQVENPDNVTEEERKEISEKVDDALIENARELDEKLKELSEKKSETVNGEIQDKLTEVVKKVSDTKDSNDDSSSAVIEPTTEDKMEVQEESGSLKSKDDVPDEPAKESVTIEKDVPKSTDEKPRSDKTEDSETNKADGTKTTEEEKDTAKTTEADKDSAKSTEAEVESAKTTEAESAKAAEVESAKTTKAEVDSATSTEAEAEGAKTSEVEAKDDKKMETEDKVVESTEPLKSEEKMKTTVDSETNVPSEVVVEEAKLISENNKPISDKEATVPESEMKISDKSEEEIPKSATTTEDKSEEATEKVPEKPSEVPTTSSPNEDKEEAMETEGGEKEDEEEEGDESESTGEKSQDESAIEGGEASGSKDANTSTAEKEDDVTNLQLAWEVLELAKVIFSRQAEADEKLEMKSADVLLKLGEVSIESENYVQAIEDLNACLKIQKKHLLSDDRAVAETFYQLGLAYSFDNQFECAVEHFTKSIQVLEERVANCRQSLEANNVTSEESASGEKLGEVAKKEIEELEGLIPEIKSKIEDTEDMMKNAKDALLEAAMQRLQEGSTNDVADSTGGSSSVQNSPSKPTTNVSHLVKRKRKPEEESVGDGAMELKKAKSIEEPHDESKLNGTNKALNGSSKQEEGNMVDSEMKPIKEVETAAS